MLAVNIQSYGGGKIEKRSMQTMTLRNVIATRHVGDPLAARAHLPHGMVTEPVDGEHRTRDRRSCVFLPPRQT